MVDREEDPSIWARPADVAGPPEPAAPPSDAGRPGAEPAADRGWPDPSAAVGPQPPTWSPEPASGGAALAPAHLAPASPGQPGGYGQVPGYGQQPTGYGPPPGSGGPGYGPPGGSGGPGYGPPGGSGGPGYGPPAYQAPGYPAGTSAVSIGRIEPVAGTPYALAIVKVPPVRSGPAIGAMVAGIASIVVSFVVFCFGIGGADAGWGALVAGAFAILALLLGAGAVVVGTPARRAILYSGGTLGGRGVAQAGLICGWIGIGLTVLAFLAALLAGTASS